MSGQSEEFEKTEVQLRDKGYREKDVTLSSGKAMGFGLLYALPFVLILGLLYRFLLIKKAHLLETSGPSFYLLFIAIIAVCVVIHELLHGVGWAAASGKGWDVVRFNISAMMPSCACKAALKKKQYLIGVLTPFVVLGLSSILFVFLYPGTISMLTLLVNFIGAGADLVIAAALAKEPDGLILDHPTQAGYILFYK